MPSKLFPTKKSHGNKSLETVTEGSIRKIFSNYNIKVVKLQVQSGPVSRSGPMSTASVKSRDHGHHEGLDSGDTLESKFSIKVS